MPEQRLDGIDTLRGVAAVSVVLFHLIPGLACSVQSPIGAVFEYGKFGVQVFFVISGAILPYALDRSGYNRLGQFWRFVAKRATRLEPPYLVSLGIVVALALSWPLPREIGGTPEPVTVAQIAFHIGYLVPLSHYQWLNAVYWTLGVELQFYVFIGLAFVALMRLPPARRIALVLVVCILAHLFPVPHLLVMTWSPLFGMGFLVFCYRRGDVSASRTVAVIVVLAVTVGVRQPVGTPGVPIMLVSVSAGLAVAFWRGLPPSLAPVGRHFGQISYSLYLIHDPVGVRVLWAVSSVTTRGIGLLVALLVVWVSAWLLWYTVERPAQATASAIRYDASPTTRLRAPVSVPVPVGVLRR